MCDMRRLNVRELHRHTGAVVEMRPVGKIGAGFPPEHWEWLKKFPRFNNDSGKFISEDRDRT